MKRIIQWMAVATALGAQAKVDLATVPERDATQLTIYNSADMTLARETRELTLRKGVNKLQFSWENTLIDPTSLEMMPKANADKIDVLDLVYPPRIKNLGLWMVDSRISGASPFEISYLTSGLSWRAFYMGTLSPDEKMLRLQGYVRVANRSGEDYENAQVRLIVGKVNLLDRIADLARRDQPHGTPAPSPIRSEMMLRKSKVAAMRSSGGVDDLFGDSSDYSMARKEIVKEGLSEYFLYTIEGTETIPNTWAKRLPSFDTDEIPVMNLYKFEEERYGTQVRRFLSFKNDEEHELGETPIPGGAMRIYRGTGKDAHLAFEGQSSFKYIPVGEKVELDLGGVENVIVEPKLMKEATANHTFHDKGTITGYDTIQNFTIAVRNTRPVPVKIEIKRNVGSNYWKLKNSGDFGDYEKDDLNTIKYTLELPPESQKTFSYQLTTYHGDNQK